VAERIGNWMQTIGGRAFYPLDPSPEDVDIEDIAHALSMVCRFGGHCSKFYSVAEHSVRVAMAIVEAGGTRSDGFAGLMHDAAEAYIGDMVWPLKQAAESAGYKRIEKRIERAIAQRFGLPEELPPIVKRFDLVLLSTEKRDLMSDGHGRRVGSAREVDAAKERLGGWHSDAFAPLEVAIDPWSSGTARGYFLALFHDWAPKEKEVPACPSTP
jgi:5'-deoxynucleotidase YfbR-like HD superfamily hydrolase